LYDEIPGTASKKGVPTPATKKAQRRDKSGASGMIEITAAPAPWSPPVERSGKKHRRAGSQRFSDVPILEQARIARPVSVFWIIGSLLLVILLAAQAAYFYRDLLADYPELRPLVIDGCESLGCSIPPPFDAGRIELVEPTSIAPHPRIANALRLRATMVNRAEKPQPYPLLEVTLTDNSGRILSRRTFEPREYLERRANATAMTPNLAINILLDVTNPDGKAVGYQIDFVAPSVH